MQWQSVDVLILADEPSIQADLQKVESAWQHADRLWVGQTVVCQSMDQLTPQIHKHVDQGKWPLVILTHLMSRPDQVQQHCQTLGQINEHMLLVLVDNWDQSDQHQALINHVTNPQRLLQMPMPQSSCQWQRLILSFAKMQHAHNDQQQVIARVEQASHEAKLIEQLAQANVNAACMMTELEEARDHAMSADRAKGHFMANMTHELRTPLSAIMGYADLMHDDMQLGEEYRDYANCIYDSGSKLLGILEDILHMTMIESDELEPGVVQRSPLRLLQQVQQDMQEKARKKGLDLCIDPSSDTWAHCPFRLHQQWLQVILSKLVDNAIKFTDKGSVTLKLKMDCQDQHKLLCFSIIDTGRGIPQEMQQTIFESFEQGDNTSSREYGGLGLGLAICRKLAEKLGAEIHVKSQPGQGSRFDLLLSVDQPCRDECRLI